MIVVGLTCSQKWPVLILVDHSFRPKVYISSSLCLGMGSCKLISCALTSTYSLYLLIIGRKRKGLFLVP
ncbi:hypothetical protein RchiOBHm_Chr1g0329991 [Rosa chinensis]|uniref:Uncharacterized protein n=1 Tax=Rosa chinensis TaxID=74649 RepID=A0A2P6SB84_ROSCH|nr:hypothetical protein RchiOBHm_Chr1g0329991 [Rosa chinensis]